MALLAIGDDADADWCNNNGGYQGLYPYSMCGCSNIAWDPATWEFDYDLYAECADAMCDTGTSGPAWAPEDSVKEEAFECRCNCKGYACFSCNPNYVPSW